MFLGVRQSEEGIFCAIQRFRFDLAAEGNGFLAVYLKLRVGKSLIQTLDCQLSSALMQLLFSFDQDMRVEKTLIQTLTGQLSSTLM